MGAVDCPILVSHLFQNSVSSGSFVICCKSPVFPSMFVVSSELLHGPLPQVVKLVFRYKHTVGAEKFAMLFCEGV